MSFLVVAVITLLWLAFFLPSYLQTRESASPYLSATSFQESLRRIGEQRPVGAPPRRRRSPSRIAARRRDIFAALSGVFVVSSLLAVSFQGWVVWAPLPSGLAFVGYVALLRAQVVRSGRPRRSPRPTVAEPAAPTAVSYAAENAIVPSVRRRAENPAAQHAPGGEPAPLERIAG